MLVLLYLIIKRTWTLSRHRHTQDAIIATLSNRSQRFTINQAAYICFGLSFLKVLVLVTDRSISNRSQRYRYSRCSYWIWSRKGHVTYQNGLSIEWCTMKIELGNLIWYLMMKTRCYIGWFGLSVYQISLFGIEFTCVKGVWLLFTKAVSNC